MRCGSCGQQNREHARYCDGCGAPYGQRMKCALSSASRDCVSCGRKIDLGVYFTVCPHCGFNYRIEVTPVDRGPAGSRTSFAGLYLISAAVPLAGFVAGAILEREKDEQSRRAAGGCVALAALNIAITPFLILRYIGWA